MNKAQKKKIKKEKKKKVSNVLDRYIVEGKKKKTKKDYNKISDLINQTEKNIQKTVERKVKSVESTEKRKEKKLMKKGSVEFTTFTSSLLTASPRTEKELKQDIEDLQEVVSTLESIDKEISTSTKKKIGVGLGIFYDKMVRRFQKIIKQNHLDDFKFIPIQRLKYHIANQIKNLKDDDFLPVLNIMVKTDLIQGLIEINPTLSFILFSEEKLELLDSEKVALSFAYEEDLLTIERLLELTQWSEEYALKTLKILLKKNLLGMVDEVIKVESFEPLEERKKWNKVIRDFLDKEKEKKEIKFQKALIKRKDLEKQLAELKNNKEESQIEEKSLKKEKMQEKMLNGPKFGNKPMIKQLSKSKSSPKEIDLKKIQEIKDKDSLIGAMDELDKEIKYSKSEKIKDTKNKNELDFSLTSKDIAQELSNIEEDISEVILSFDEKYSMMNAGFVQYEKLREFILQKYANIDERLVKKVINQLLKLKMIHNSIEIGKFTFYLFKELDLNKKEKIFISSFINKSPIGKDDLKNELNWDEEQILKIMTTLQKKGILRLESDRIMIPGIVQNENKDDFIIF
ncbi:MAG: hypothetical protein KGD63_02170 [Candidatus Lokiarchaeota archaeon]|nr:hypothetical protein [Candidatus Lokiarchaeota archaeon]